MNETRTTERREERFLITLLRASILDEPVQAVPEDLNWNRLFSIAEAHIVEATVYRAVAPLSACPPKLLARWKAHADNALRVELLYDGERASLCALFEREGIDYMPLKGILLKDLYPHRGMRQFADNDILYDKKKKRRLKKLMKAQGYRAEKSSNYSAHDAYTKPPVFNFEMHRTLFNRSESIPYFDDVWKRAIKGEGHAYSMTNEDFYLFNLAHFNKHYTHGGAGIRFFADLFLLRRDLPFDRARVDEALREIGMTEFEREMAEIAEAWFGSEPREIPQETFEFIVTSGAYGTLEHSVETQVRESGGLFRFIFLPYKEMKARFPFLKYLPFLLPFCWLFRLVRAPFNRSKVKRAVLVAKYGKERRE